MKIFVFIASVAVLGCIAVEGYGHRNHHSHHPHHFERFEHEQHGSHKHPHGPHHKHSHHHTQSHENVRPPPWLESFESGESSFESNSEPDYNSYESTDEESWYSSRHHHCKGWRCPPKTTRKPCQERPNTPKPIRTWHTKPSKTDETRRTTSSAPDMSIPDIAQWDITTSAPLIDPLTNNWHTIKPSPTIWFIPGDTTNSQTQSPNTIKEQSPTDTTFPSSKHTRNTWYTSNDETTRLPTTTSSLGTTPEMSIISNFVSNCLNNCQSTPEYNPVCGTNGETYNNIGRLNCAKSCGIDVDLRRTSACPPPNVDDEGDRSSTTPPTLTITAATATSASVRGTDLTTFHNCMKQCPVTSAYSPVCGTDRVTYINIDRMKCAISCGQDVQFLCERPCAICYETVKTTSTTPKATTQTASSVNKDRTNLSITIEQCITSCPVTFEYNPVCGSNGVTYTNPGYLLCAQMCGEDVRVAQFASCSPSTTESSSTTTQVYQDVSLSPAISSCITRCPVTSEYNPVCGTNGRTYENPGRLDCAKYCGVNVELREQMPCFLLTTKIEQPASATTTSRSIIIEGNKDIVPTQSMTEKVTSSPSTQSWDNLPTPLQTTRTSSSTSSQQLIDSTIQPDLLHSVFNFNPNFTNTQPTKEAPKKVSEYEYDIDPRFGNESDK